MPGRDGYAPVLALILLVIVAGSLGPRPVASLVGAVLVAVVWLAVARASRMTPGRRLAGLVVLAAAAALALAAYAVGGPALRAIADLALAAGVVLVIAIVAADLARAEVVTVSVIAGVLCLYLLLGLLYGQVYAAATEIDGGAFSGGERRRFDLLYFSFVTQTTVGFGDIAPAGDGTRALAMSQAVLGQLFLVTVVARAVSLLGSARPRSR